MMAMFNITSVDAFAMARCVAAPIDLTNKPRHRLEAIVHQHSAPQSLVMRARIILLGATGTGVRETAEQLRLGRATVQRWRARWQATSGRPFRERLADAPRPGTPATFTPEQICAIIALACENPSDTGLPITHWTHSTLAEEAIARGIVTEISSHAIGRFLREVDLKPHRTRGWISSPRDAQFEEKCRDVCETYRLAPERAAAGIQTRSIDEMTGVQALERAAPTLPMRPGRTERREFEYIRQGTFDPHRLLRCRHRPGHLSPRADPHRGRFRRVARRAARQPRRHHTLVSDHGQPQHPRLRSGGAPRRRGHRLHRRSRRQGHMRHPQVGGD
ncbi:MAG: helix-turn-helix domain-containing protein, partial [Sphingobacteriia bacterium]|nr:helix-turn-helix domain-containing protein [Sphingobacteriia bacterium]